MTVTIDKFGRVLIPKALRDRLGLTPGTALALGVRDAGDGPPALELRAEPREPLLAKEGGRLVFTGRLERLDLDVVQTLREGREARALRHAGLDSSPGAS